jgi:hypothetical protein
VTANDGELGEDYLRAFQDNEKTIPTILTTSQKLSTGVDARNIRHIVILRPVKSIIEFKQIIGRGTRLYDGKDYFTIHDFFNASHNFYDPEWDGDPDIDAMARLTFKPLVKFDTTIPYFSNKISPFNSQNTFLAREVIPYYTVFPYVGRMDDIWAGYYLQTLFSENLVYAPASVYQERNLQDLITNLEKEVIGYRNTLRFIKNKCDLKSDFIPEETRTFLRKYKECFA